MKLVWTDWGDDRFLEAQKASDGSYEIIDDRPRLRKVADVTRRVRVINPKGWSFLHKMRKAS